MVGSRYWETIQDFHDALRGAVAHITSAILLREGPLREEPLPPAETTGRFRLSEARAPLGGPGSHLALSIAMRFRVESASADDDQWRIETFAYSYLLFHDNREIVGYHWDDEANATRAFRTPHVHFGKDLPHPGLPREDRDRLGSLAAAHMPTGLIPFTEILRAAIRDFGVDPIRQQGDSLDDTQARTRQRFEEAESAMLGSFAWWKGRGSDVE